MKKMLFLVMSLFMLLYTGSTNALAQAQPDTAQPVIEPTKFGVGFQGSWPAYGISGMMDVTDELSVQGIVGFMGTLNTYAGRGLYRFNQDDLWNLYGYGMAGAWTYSLLGISETVFGFGAGAGIEYDWRAWSPGLPPIFWNLEAGFGLVNFETINYNFSTFMIGAGAHYRF